MKIKAREMAERRTTRTILRCERGMMASDCEERERSTFCAEFLGYATSEKLYREDEGDESLICVGRSRRGRVRAADAGALLKLCGAMVDVVGIFDGG